VWGNNIAAGVGVYGNANGSGTGVVGSDYVGVAGIGTYGIYGTSAVSGGNGGYFSTSGSSPGSPVYATAAGTSTSVTAIYGTNPSGADGVGVSGHVGGSGGCYGVQGQSTSDQTSSSSYSYGTWGKSGTTSSAWYCVGVYGATPGTTVQYCYAGYFVGSIIKSGGSFLIDHPLDPENRWLEHSFVESPDMMNVYNGVVTANSSGEAEVQMPTYFEALNTDFRYQLTALGAAAPNLHVKQEMTNGRFVIGGATPKQRISWQVTGVRQDPWAEKNRIVPEYDKAVFEKGLYKHPEVYGKPASKGTGWASEQRARRDRDKAPAQPKWPAS